MIRMFPAMRAILFEHDFFGRVDLVSAGNVVLGFADRADQCKYQTLIFFRHNEAIIAEISDLLKKNVLPMTYSSSFADTMALAIAVDMSARPASE